MKTVLLITARVDPQADFLLAELRRRNVPCVRWNTYEFPLASHLTYRAANDGFSTHIATDGRALNFAEVGSVWWQWDRPAGFPPGLAGQERHFAETEALLAVSGLQKIGDSVWINDPSRERLAQSKPAQLYVAQQVGLEIPSTIITNNPAEVRRFVAATPGPVVYKASSQLRDVEPGKVLFTGLVTPEILANIDQIQWTPGIFQAQVQKAHELRITVIGTRLFVVKIGSQDLAETKLDWRRSQYDVAYEVATLPADIERKLLAFMQAFGLTYGAFDMIVTPEGRHVFLEINPGGAYMWLEAATGLEITAALVDALSAPCR